MKLPDKASVDDNRPPSHPSWTAALDSSVRESAVAQRLLYHRYNYRSAVSGVGVWR